MAAIYVERLGLVPYEPVLALQRQRHAEVVAGEAEETLFLLQHEPVITFGRNRGAGHLLASPDQLATRGVALCATERGGDITYHGPGQIVGYPILRLGPTERDISAYVWRLEEIMLRTAADFGVSAARQAGMRGIWAGGAKLGAVGVRVSNWVTLHGWALNVAPDLDRYGLIVPCGIQGCAVTSLQAQLGRAPEMEAVEQRLVTHTAAVLDRTARDAPVTPLPDASGFQKAI